MDHKVLEQTHQQRHLPIQPQAHLMIHQRVHQLQEDFLLQQPIHRQLNRRQQQEQGWAPGAQLLLLEQWRTQQPQLNLQQLEAHLLEQEQLQEQELQQQELLEEQAL